MWPSWRFYLGGSNGNGRWTDSKETRETQALHSKIVIARNVRGGAQATKFGSNHCLDHRCRGFFQLAFYLCVQFLSNTLPDKDSLSFFLERSIHEGVMPQLSLVELRFSGFKTHTQSLQLL